MGKKRSRSRSKGKKKDRKDHKKKSKRSSRSSSRSASSGSRDRKRNKVSKTENLTKSNVKDNKPTETIKKEEIPKETNEPSSGTQVPKTNGDEIHKTSTEINEEELMKRMLGFDDFDTTKVTYK